MRAKLGKRELINNKTEAGGGALARSENHGSSVTQARPTSKSLSAGPPTANVRHQGLRNC